MAILALTSCGDDGGRGYAVPDRLCGIEIDADALAPLLPDGKEITERKFDVGSERLSCTLSVDSDFSLSVKGDLLAADADPFKSADWSMRLGGDSRPSPSALESGALIRDSLAVAVKPCRYEDSARRYAVLVELVGSNQSPEDSAERGLALSKFADDFVPAAVQAQGCA
ncbi:MULTISPECIES: hypothetical protein [unclassified Streptomyces]|uniref:hypothetical protein n=1 Tax=unclassified Streptomyces TaxID=2593676 RepID=UPI000938BF12|nr:hypothetical protein [Streptomyces sp. TSRI0281]